MPRLMRGAGTDQSKGIVSYSDLLYLSVICYI